MKLSRIIGYGAAGIIVGLLLENKTLKIKERVACKAGQLKKKAKDMVHKVA